MLSAVLLLSSAEAFQAPMRPMVHQASSRSSAVQATVFEEGMSQACCCRFGYLLS